MKLLVVALPVGFGFGLLLLVMSFLFDGLGFSRIYGYWDHYNGSMSWAAYRVTLRPQGQGPAPDRTFPTLHYGFNLTDHVTLKAQLLQSEVPVPDMGPLLYDTTHFASFSPDSVYYAWVGLRANYFSFALGARPAFAVTTYQAAAAPASVPDYPVQTNWRGPLRLYAWVALSLEIVFMVAMVGLILLDDYPAAADRLLALVLVLVYAAAAGYVDWLDYQTSGHWPILKPLLVVGLLVGYVVQLRASLTKASAPAAEPADASAG